MIYLKIEPSDSHRHLGQIAASLTEAQYEDIKSYLTTSRFPSIAETKEASNQALIDSEAYLKSIANVEAIYNDSIKLEKQFYAEKAGKLKEQINFFIGIGIACLLIGAAIMWKADSVNQQNAECFKVASTAQISK